jgi:hypothetical protein
MSRKKKSGHKKPSLEKILLVTATLELIEALIEMINKLLE